jgi:hypothetical protein
LAILFSKRIRTILAAIAAVLFLMFAYKQMIAHSPAARGIEDSPAATPSSTVPDPTSLTGMPPPKDEPVDISFGTPHLGDAETADALLNSAPTTTHESSTGQENKVDDAFVPGVNPATGLAGDGIEENVDWSRFAYTQYVTTSVYLCNSVMAFEALQRLGSKADRVLMYPRTWSPDEDSETGKLTRLARDKYGAKLIPIEVQVGGQDGKISFSRMIWEPDFFFNARRIQLTL